MNQIIGHRRQFNYLRRVLMNKHLAHAYLFSGPKQIGKFTIARMIASVLHCKHTTSSDTSACNKCDDCTKIEQNTHPNVTLLDTTHTLISKKEERHEIPIEDIRELKRKSALAPTGKWRIAIIRNAEHMSLAAANAFLKLLEEPNSQVLLILITSNIELILPTIISRTVPIHFNLVADDELRQLTEKHDLKNQSAHTLIDLAGGRPGKLMNLINDSEYFDRETRLKNVVRHVVNGSISDALRLAERVANEPSLQHRVFEHIARALRGDLIYSVNHGTINMFNIEKIKRIHNIFERLLTTNVNRRLALDIAMLEAQQKA